MCGMDAAESSDPHRKIVEVETSPEKRGHVAKDFNKMADGYDEAIWVAEDFESVRVLVNKLVDEGCLSDEIDRRVRNFDDLNEQLDADGMCEIIGMTDLMGRI